MDAVIEYGYWYTQRKDSVPKNNSISMEHANGHPAVQVLSPSKITDYFSSKTSPSCGPEEDTCDTDNDRNSSVYLTPESSPLKDQQDDVSQYHISDTGSESKPHIPTEPCQLQSSTVLICNGAGACESAAPVDPIESSPHKVSKTNDSNDLSKCIKTETTSDTSKRKSNPHRICRVTASAKVEEDNSVQVSPGESAFVASPLLSRPKVRKNSKTKSSEPGGQSNPESKPAVAVTNSKRGRKKKTSEPVQTTAITDYFPVRRSGRQTKSQIEKETQLHIEKLIHCKCEDGLEVKEFEGKGRGIVTTKIFDKGDFVVEYAGDLTDVDMAKDRELEYALTPSIGCYMYFFNHKNKQYCVDATQESGRLGRLINHSREGNCNTKVVMVDGRPHLILVAAKHIKKGQELCYDYGDRSKASLEAHPWLKL